MFVPTYTSMYLSFFVFCFRFRFRFLFSLSRFIFSFVLFPLFRPSEIVSTGTTSQSGKGRYMYIRSDLFWSSADNFHFFFFFHVFIGLVYFVLRWVFLAKIAVLGTFLAKIASYSGLPGTARRCLSGWKLRDYERTYA